MLTADDGYKIATKVGATPKDRRNHKRVTIVLHGQVIGSYGIRRGSHELGHDFIAGQIGLTQREARDLSLCPLTLQEYIKLLESRGRLKKEEKKENKKDKKHKK